MNSNKMFQLLVILAVIGSAFTIADIVSAQGFGPPCDAPPGQSGIHPRECEGPPGKPDGTPGNGPCNNPGNNPNCPDPEPPVIPPTPPVPPVPCNSECDLPGEDDNGSPFIAPLNSPDEYASMMEELEDELGVYEPMDTMQEVLLEYGNNGHWAMFADVPNFQNTTDFLSVSTEAYLVHYGYGANDVIEPIVHEYDGITYYIYIGEWLYDSYFFSFGDRIENVLTLKRQGVPHYRPITLTPDDAHPWQWDLDGNFVLFQSQAPIEVLVHIDNGSSTHVEFIFDDFASRLEEVNTQSL